MDGRTAGGGRGRVRPIAARVIVAVLAAWVVAGPPALPLRAGPIRGHRHPGVHAARALGPGWGRFLAGGPTVWASTRPPRFRSGLHLLSVRGQLVETPFVDYLVWRRSLNPARFDHYHPVVGPELAQLGLPIVPTAIPRIQTQSLSPPVPLPPKPQLITPEPGSLTLTCALLGFAARRRLRRGVGAG